METIEFVGDIMDGEMMGIIIGLDDYDEMNGEFEDEAWDIGDEDGRPLDSIYRY